MLEYRALRCTSGEMAILTILYTYELWSDDIVQGTERLDQAAAQELNGIVGANWEHL
jgi:hypothetical protein